MGGKNNVSGNWIETEGTTEISSSMSEAGKCIFHGNLYLFIYALTVVCIHNIIAPFRSVKSLFLSTLGHGSDKLSI